ncbi:unnamed protein product [Amoebophrya sp. A120]|nr:unnamed protein product [Amoebophrya sp. A120]|eukprot:GSA120T00023375001.1
MALKGKRVAIILDFTYEDLEVCYPQIRLQEEGAEVKHISLHKPGTKVTGKYGYPTLVDQHISDANPADFDAVICPGGFAPDYYRRDAAMKDFVTNCFLKSKPVAAICHGPWMLCSARKSLNGGCPESRQPLCKGLKVTAFHAIKDDLENAGAEFVDAPVVVDRNVITSRTPKDLVPWTLAIIEALKYK